MTIAEPRAFIRANTQLQAVPHAPEIRLWLADEVTPLWRLTQEELGEMGLPPPFWAFAWAGGQALSRYVLDHPQEVSGQRVLDFAAGSGLVGVAAMKAGAASVVCADIDPFCEAAVQLNAEDNQVELTFCGQDLLRSPPEDFDVICAGDICYEKPMAEAVLNWLSQARAKGARVLIGDPGRTYFPKSGLEFLAEYSVPTSRELEDLAIKRSCVWALP
ncbi:hypothetical protein LTR94_025536 [Friedmanniomyces endolithicus]|nr:hypothetical protein LTR94_025536 [Friedmanniomyces endolithicus]